MEAAAQSQIVVFDKTGTLTSGELKMHAMVFEKQWLSNKAKRHMLQAMICAIANRSRHPVSRMLKAACSNTSDNLNEIWVTDHGEHPGLGQAALATVDGQNFVVVIGSLRFMQTQGIYLADVSCSDSMGPVRILRGVVYVSVNGQLAARITYTDEVTPGAAETVRTLHERGFKTFLMTGDINEPAQGVAKEVGISADHVHASLLPHDKASLIESLERRYGPVVMVGDNLNDAPALAAATFGIVMASDTRKERIPGGTSHDMLNAFYAEADALVMPDNSPAAGPGGQGLTRVLYVLALIKETSARMEHILRWSLVYNIAALSVVSGLMGALLPERLSRAVNLDA